MMDRHDTDPVALVFGIAAMAAGAIFFLGGEVASISAAWIVPAVMVALGLGVGAFALASLGKKKDEYLAPSPAMPSDRSTDAENPEGRA